MLVIFHDVVWDNKFYQSPSLKILSRKGRHIYIATILTFQYLNLIPPVAQNNLDFLFVG